MSWPAITDQQPKASVRVPPQCALVTQRHWHVEQVQHTLQIEKEVGLRKAQLRVMGIGANIYYLGHVIDSLVACNAAS